MTVTEQETIAAAKGVTGARAAAAARGEDTKKAQSKSKSKEKEKEKEKVTTSNSRIRPRSASQEHRKQSKHNSMQSKSHGNRSRREVMQDISSKSEGAAVNVSASSRRRILSQGTVLLSQNKKSSSKRALLISQTTHHLSTTTSATSYAMYTATSSSSTTGANRTHRGRNSDGILTTALETSSDSNTNADTDVNKVSAEVPAKATATENDDTPTSTKKTKDRSRNNATRMTKDKHKDKDKSKDQNKERPTTPRKKHQHHRSKIMTGVSNKSTATSSPQQGTPNKRISNSRRLRPASESPKASYNRQKTLTQQGKALSQAQLNIPSMSIVPTMKDGDNDKDMDMDMDMETDTDMDATSCSQRNRISSSSSRRTRQTNDKSNNNNSTTIIKNEKINRRLEQRQRLQQQQQRREQQRMEHLQREIKQAKALEEQQQLQQQQQQLQPEMEGEQQNDNRRSPPTASMGFKMPHKLLKQAIMAGASKFQLKKKVKEREHRMSTNANVSMSMSFVQPQQNKKRPIEMTRGGSVFKSIGLGLGTTNTTYSNTQQFPKNKPAASSANIIMREDTTNSLTTYSDNISSTSMLQPQPQQRAQDDKPVDPPSGELGLTQIGTSKPITRTAGSRDGVEDSYLTSKDNKDKDYNPSKTVAAVLRIGASFGNDVFDAMEQTGSTMESRISSASHMTAPGTFQKYATSNQHTMRKVNSSSQSLSPSRSRRRRNFGMFKQLSAPSLTGALDYHNIYANNNKSKNANSELEEEKSVVSAKSISAVSDRSDGDNQQDSASPVSPTKQKRGSLDKFLNVKPSVTLNSFVPPQIQSLVQQSAHHLSRNKKLQERNSTADDGHMELLSESSSELFLPIDSQQQKQKPKPKPSSSTVVNQGKNRRQSAMPPSTGAISTDGRQAKDLVRIASNKSGIDLSDFETDRFSINSDSCGVSREEYLQLVVDSLTMPATGKVSSKSILNHSLTSGLSRDYSDAAMDASWKSLDYIIDRMREEQTSRRYTPEQVHAVQQDFASQVEMLGSQEQNDLLKKIRSLSQLGATQFDRQNLPAEDGASQQGPLDSTSFSVVPNERLSSELAGIINNEHEGSKRSNRSTRRRSNSLTAVDSLHGAIESKQLMISTLNKIRLRHDESEERGTSPVSDIQHSQESESTHSTIDSMHSNELSQKSIDTRSNSVREFPTAKLDDSSEPATVDVLSDADQPVEQAHGVHQSEEKSDSLAKIQLPTLTLRIQNSIPGKQGSNLNNLLDKSDGAFGANDPFHSSFTSMGSKLVQSSTKKPTLHSSTRSDDDQLSEAEDLYNSIGSMGHHLEGLRDSLLAKMVALEDDDRKSPLLYARTSDATNVVKKARETDEKVPNNKLPSTNLAPATSDSRESDRILKDPAVNQHESFNDSKSYKSDTISEADTMNDTAHIPFFEPDQDSIYENEVEDMNADDGSFVEESASISGQGPGPSARPAATTTRLSSSRHDRTLFAMMDMAISYNSNDDGDCDDIISNNYDLTNFDSDGDEREKMESVAISFQADRTNNKESELNKEFHGIGTRKLTSDDKVGVPKQHSQGEAYDDFKTDFDRRPNFSGDLHVDGSAGHLHSNAAVPDEHFHLVRTWSEKKVPGGRDTKVGPRSTADDDTTSQSSLKPGREKSILDLELHGPFPFCRMAKPLYARPNMQEINRNKRRHDIAQMGGCPSFYDEHLYECFNFIPKIASVLPRLMDDEDEYDDYFMSSSLAYRQWAGMPNVAELLQIEEDEEDNDEDDFMEA